MHVKFSLPDLLSICTHLKLSHGTNKQQIWILHLSTYGQLLAFMAHDWQTSDSSSTWPQQFRSQIFVLLRWNQIAPLLRKLSMRKVLDPKNRITRLHCPMTMLAWEQSNGLARAATCLARFLAIVTSCCSDSKLVGRQLALGRKQHCSPQGVDLNSV